MGDIFIQSKVIGIFPKFKMAAAAILDFQFMRIWPFRRVGSVVFVYYAKFGSNICYSHWDRHQYASNLHLMTSRDLTSGFDFWSQSSPHRCDASSHIIWCKISLSSPKLLTFFRNSRWRRRHLGFSVYVNLAIRRVGSVVFVFSAEFGSNICYSHWDRHTYASDLHLMTSRELTSGFDFWSRGHLRVAVVHLPI